jgi:thiol-disulfide isomerase/thioredoxin
MRYFITLSFFCILFQSCIEVNAPFSKIPPGTWRGILELDNLPYAGAVAEVSVGAEEGDFLPFLFDVVYDNVQDFHIELINDDERIIIDDIEYGRDKATAKDTIIIKFTIFDSYIKAIYEENIMEGSYHVNYRDNYSIPFKAVHGQNFLFSTDKKNDPVNIQGKWAVTFELDTEDEYPAIGEFYQEEDKLSGTFLTETGDYRYLTGQIISDKFYLSTFDGSHAFLFKGKVLEDGSISGIFRSGTHYTTPWIAIKDKNATLTGAYDLTKLKTDNNKLAFTFEGLDGSEVSISDVQFDGKPKLIQIFGTWCPNCMDETKFLIEYLEKNADLQLEVFAIGFERYKDNNKSIAALKRFKSKLNVPYQVLYGGYYEKEIASDKFPMLNKILSYPTLLFVNRKNEVVKIHTGFTGPATSEFPAFVADFNKNIQLITE